MFRQSLLVFLLLISACAVFAQQTDSKVDRNFAFVFGEESGYLGIQTEEVTRENFSKFGLAKVQGVAVEKVLENSPAAQAGVEAGDVILKFDGEEVSSVRKLMRLINEVAPDHEVVLIVSRGGREREIGVTLGKRPAMAFPGNERLAMRIPVPNGQFPQLPPMTSVPQMRRLPMPGDADAPSAMIWRFGGRRIGITASPLTNQLAEYFGVADGNGLLVGSVRENSPAARAGLKAGDVIVAADGREVKGEMDLIRVLNEKKEGDVSLIVIRDKNRQTIRVTPEPAGEDFRQFENFVRPADLPQMNFQPLPSMPSRVL
jgi:serine protease Do